MDNNAPNDGDAGECGSDVDEDDSKTPPVELQTPQVTGAESTLAVDVCSDVPQTNQVSSDVPQTNQVSSDVSQTNQVSSDVPQTNQVSSDVPQTNQVSSDVLQTNQASSDVPQTNQVSSDVPQTNQVSSDVPQTNQVSSDGNSAEASAGTDSQPGLDVNDQGSMLSIAQQYATGQVVQPPPAQLDLPRGVQEQDDTANDIDLMAATALPIVVDLHVVAFGNNTPHPLPGDVDIHDNDDDDDHFDVAMLGFEMPAFP